MSAIEMMDPKMDAGMIGNQVNRKVLNFEQAVKVTHSNNEPEYSEFKNEYCILYWKWLFVCLCFIFLSCFLFPLSLCLSEGWGRTGEGSEYSWAHRDHGHMFLLSGQYDIANTLYCVSWK